MVHLETVGKTAALWLHSDEGPSCIMLDLSYEALQSNESQHQANLGQLGAVLLSGKQKSAALEENHF